MNADSNLINRVERLEQQYVQGWEALMEQPLPQALLDQDMAHPELLKAEAQAGLEHFMHCFCAYRAFRFENAPGTRMDEKVTLVEAYCEATCQLLELLRRMRLAGLAFDELGDQYKQVVYQWFPALMDS